MLDFAWTATSRRTTGTPRPWTLQVSGQVSWLAGRRGCLAFPMLGTSGIHRQLLAVHSCGGSAGLGTPFKEHRTGFPLSLRAAFDSEDPDGAKLARHGCQVNGGRHPARAGNFSCRRAFRLPPALCAGSSHRRAGDSPKPQMRVHAVRPDCADRLQVSVLTAKKCRFHAPRGQDAKQRVA